MATIDRIRLENLRAKAAELGGLRAFAEKVNRSESQVSQFLGKNPTRKVGNRLARSLEIQLKLKEGALDVAPRGTPEGVRDAAPSYDALSPVALSFARMFDKLPLQAQTHLLGIAQLLALVSKKSYQQWETNMEAMNRARDKSARRKHPEPSEQ